jgi:release factor glutamine methyltransferase
VGTGSGCIAVTLARELGRARIIATDVSPEALRVAWRNAARHGLAERLTFIAGDLLDPLAAEPLADFIVSNPPYVAEREVATLQREVRDWEPRVALTDFADGLSFYRRLLQDAPTRLKPGGHLICEMGYAQAEQIASLAEERVWGERRTLADLQGIPRTLVLRRR